MDDDIDCTRALHALYAFLDGELTSERRAFIEYHLNGCPQCFSAFDFEAELRIVVRSRLRTEVPAALMARIAQAIEVEQSRADGPRSEPPGPAAPSSTPAPDPRSSAAEMPLPRPPLAGETPFRPHSRRGPEPGHGRPPGPLGPRSFG
jgi:anti-sigma factor (TIGR02949 family)